MTATIGSVGLADFARFKTNGSEIVDYKVPFDLWFVPNPDLAALWPDARQRDARGRPIPFYDQLTQIPEDSYLFEVWVRDVPNDPRRFPEGSQVQHIANIKATSSVITSNFGDTRLFFQHEFMG